MSLRTRLALRLLGASAGKGDYDDGHAAARRETTARLRAILDAHPMRVTGEIRQLIADLQKPAKESARWGA